MQSLNFLMGAFCEYLKIWSDSAQGFMDQNLFFISKWSYRTFHPVYMCKKHFRPTLIDSVKYSTVQYSTVQYSTVQYSTVGSFLA